MPNNAGIIQLVECLLAKQNVVGSNPISRSKIFIMYKVYFTNEHGEARAYNEETLTGALQTAEGLRRQTRYSFVSIVSEDPNCVGKAGVDSVKDGKTPDGHVYSWVKRRRP